MKVFILALATAVPAISLHQDEVAEYMIQALNIQEPTRSYVRSIYSRSAISKRYSVIEDFKNAPDEASFWGTSLTTKVPGMKARNDVYKDFAPVLASDASHKALEDWGYSPQSITHIISVSCTGVMAPGIEFLLMKSLGLSHSVNRLGINFMGCFGAFAGLRVAYALAQENPRNRILLVCTELCSLHFQTDLNVDTLVANALFADGAGAVIIGAEPQACEKPIWELIRFKSEALEETLDQMSWQAGDNGFIMHLTQAIPTHIQKNILSFVQSLLGDISPCACAWPIHPGGKAIIKTIEQTCALKQTQTQASWNVLDKYGNMSSPTFLFVLNELRNQPRVYDWSIGIGFGPGLSIEGILLKNMY